MAEWVKAAELQLELHRWLTSERGRRWTRGWIEAEIRSEPSKGHMYGLLAAAEPQKLLTADSIWVDPEMTELISIAREDFQPEIMANEDFLVHTGFCYFAEPILIHDRNRRVISLGAISWCPIRFTNKTLDEVEAGGLPELTQDGSEIVSHDPSLREDLWGIDLTLYTSTVDDRDDYHATHVEARRQLGAPELLPLHYIPVVFGEPLDEGHLLDEYGRPTGAEEWWKTVQVTLRLMQQRIVSQEDAHVPRATRRRYERAGMYAPSQVCIIRLRRTKPKTGDHEETGRTLTHRHIREGHWRNQWYPSVQRHRQIRIQRTIVGDDSLPLIVKRRFYRWDR